MLPRTKKKKKLQSPLKNKSHQLMKEEKFLTLGIIGNTSKDEVSKLLIEIVDYLVSMKITFLIEENIASVTSSRLRKHSATQSKILSETNCILSLGGDGTFLNTARIVGNRNIPILGVNLGRLGFFSEVSPKEIKKFIPNLLQHKFRITEQVIIKCNANGKVIYGLNDIVVDKSDSIRMIETETFYNGEKIVMCLSDGMIVSTPAGSTGYSLSCSGPIVNPDSSVFVITPISPHTLNVRPIIVPDNGEIKIKVYKESKARITADGQKAVKINTPSEIILEKADYTIKVIKKLDTTYFNTLKKKLFWGEDKRHS